MGITRADFDRLLPSAASAAGALRWRVEALPGAPRRIGLLAMPVLHVTLEVDGGPQAAVDRFVARFLLAFQRAGG